MNTDIVVEEHTYKLSAASATVSLPQSPTRDTKTPPPAAEQQTTPSHDNENNICYIKAEAAVM
jgi:hypothetical protein